MGFWFRDPRTPAQRKAQVRVPRKSAKYRGTVRETKAVFRTRDGSLAVPVGFAFGHQIVKGQAVTLNRAGIFGRGTATPTQAAGKQLRRLSKSLLNVSSVRCEGYADYSVSRAKARKLAKKRAARVCGILEAGNGSLATTTASYGSTRPAVLGGKPGNRRLNRRVVVEVTGIRKMDPEPQPPVATIPGAPVLDYVHGVREGVRFGFGAPDTDGGSPVTGYEVSTGSGWAEIQPLTEGQQQRACDGTCGPELVHGQIVGLTPGTAVTLQVRAVNAVGAGAASATQDATVFGVPSAPTELNVTADAGRIFTSFSAPASDGGAPVESYEISHDGGKTWTVAELTGSAPWTVTESGFDNGSSYEVHVRSTTAYGFGAAATQEVFVDATPGAPSLSVPVLDGRTATLAFTPPASTGGRPVIGYQVTLDGGQTWDALTTTAVGSELTAELTGLTYGETYDVGVRAVNDRGASASSNQHQVTATTVPDAPTDLVATGGATSVELTFAAPAFTGGTAITGYQVSTDGGPWADTNSTVGVVTLTNLERGTRGFRVRAVNAVGTSPSTAAVEVEVLGAAPSVYRAEFYYSGGLLWSYAFFTTVPDAVSYEARIDGGDWLPVTIEADWITEHLGYIDDPVCGASACSSAREIEVRAVYVDGYSAASSPFIMTYFFV